MNTHLMLDALAWSGWVFALMFAIALIRTDGRLKRAWRREDDWKQLVIDTRLSASLAALRAARTIAPALLLLCLPSLASAQTKPLAVAFALDAASTEYAVARGAVELNPLLGAHPVQRIAVKSAAFIGAVYCVERVKRSHPRFAKALAYSLSGVYVVATIHNVRVGRSIR